MKTIIVCGCHRSATSLVAKGLAQVIPMGDRFADADDNNPNGYYEDLDFVELHRKIFNEAVGFNLWADPEDVSKVIGRYKLKMKRFVDRDHTFGFKDPRATVLIGDYFDICDDPIAVFCVRKPDKTIESMVKNGKNWKTDDEKRKTAEATKVYVNYTRFISNFTGMLADMAEKNLE